MTPGKTVRQGRAAGLLLLLIGILAGCQTSFYGVRETVADQKNRIDLLDGGPHEGIWETIDLTLAYTYFRKPGTLELSGEVEFDDSLKYNFVSLNDFDLMLNLLDGQGNILDRISLLGPGRQRQLEKLPFARRLVLAPAAAAIAFSYSGKLRGSGGDSSFWDIWKSP